MKLSKNKEISKSDFCKISRFRLIQMEIAKMEAYLKTKQNKRK